MSTKDEANAPVPRDVRLVALILASMGIEDAEPAVLIQLLEFANRALPTAHQGIQARSCRTRWCMRITPARVRAEALCRLTMCSSRYRAV